MTREPLQLDRETERVCETRAVKGRGCDDGCLFRERT
jgi:hypothetical protein